MSDKATKAEVDYSRGHSHSRCGICRYYHDRSCSKVKGEIDPQMWCRLFKHKFS